MWIVAADATVHAVRAVCAQRVTERRLSKLLAGGWRGRTQYVNILKAIVEDDVQVTWVTPHIPSRHPVI